jgi:hypothetical protein
MMHCQAVPPDETDGRRLVDFHAALIAATLWYGKTEGGVGERPLYSAPALEESNIFVCRKDIFGQDKTLRA